jgi:hypothetical protein
MFITSLQNVRACSGVILSGKSFILFDGDNDATIGHEMERTIVVNLTYEMDGVTSGFSRNADGGDGLVCGLDSDASVTNLRLLPPNET